MHTAFGITPLDIETVLQNNAKLIEANHTGDFEELSNALFDKFTPEDFGRVERAALDSGIEMDEQTDGAHEEIRIILIEKNVLHTPTEHLAARNNPKIK